MAKMTLIQVQEENEEKNVQGVAVVKLADGYVYRQEIRYPIDTPIGPPVFKVVKQNKKRCLILAYDGGSNIPIFYAPMKEVIWYGVVVSLDGSSTISKEC